MKIQATRQFSHYHLGTVDQAERRNVPDDVAKALISMGLADPVNVEGEAPAAKPAGTKPTRRARVSR